MQRVMHALALRLGVPVYQLRAEMPASEFAGWLLYFKEEANARSGPEPPSIDDVDPKTFIAGLGGGTRGS
jgi:hypothetical protein